MGLFSFAKGFVEKNKLFQFFSWKHQPHISCQTHQMEGWATGTKKDFRGFDLETYSYSEEKGKQGQSSTGFGRLGVA